MEADQNEEKSSGLFLFAVMRLEDFFQKRIIKKKLKSSGEIAIRFYESAKNGKPFTRFFFWV